MRFLHVEPGVQLGRYEIVEELGAGGMATVYLARDLELRRDVAVKLLFPHLCRKPDVVTRFQREARAAAALDHPNIMKVFDVGGGVTDAGEAPFEPPYIVLELVRGESLRHVAKTNAPLLAEAAACIAVVLCRALGEAHRAGIVHRDVKPANVMIAEGGRLVLADFGVARIEDEDSLVTRTGALLGTPAFMSPEQARGVALDARSDLYSLGATLYQLATGSMPYAGPTPQVVGAILSGDRMPVQRRNPAVGPDLAAVIDRLMAPDPADRFADAADAERALCRMLDAAEIREPEAELGELFADPDAYAAAHMEHVLRRTVERAREAAQRRSLPRAMALLDRALSLDPDDAEALALVDGLGTTRARWKWAAGVGFVVAAAAVAVVALRGGATDDAKRRAVSGATDAGLVLAAVAMDAGTRSPTMDARAALVHATPTDAAVIDARRRRAVRANTSRRTRRPDAALALATPRQDAAPRRRVLPDARLADATISLVMSSWCDVTIDGRSLGRAKRGKRIRLSPGSHQVTCSQGRGLGIWRTTIRLKPGEHRDLVGTVLRRVRVRVHLTSGDAMRVRGRRYTSGSTLTLAPGRVRVEVLAGINRIASRWITIPRMASCTLRDQPAIGCYR